MMDIKIRGYNLQARLFDTLRLHCPRLRRRTGDRSWHESSHRNGRDDSSADPTANAIL